MDLETLAHMKHRKLRIAWSLLWGALAVLLMLLFVRSLWRIDWVFYLTPTVYANAASRGGVLGFWYESEPPANLVLLLQHGWHFTSEPIPTLRGSWRPSVHMLRIPHWLVAGLFAAIGAGPWVRWQFSLRSMLIATTLAAAALGLLVWLNR